MFCFSFSVGFIFFVLNYYNNMLDLDHRFTMSEIIIYVKPRHKIS